MAAIHPILPQRPRCRWFWRSMLAVLMGLVTWWTVGQLLAPKPVWTLNLEDSTVDGYVRGMNEHDEWLFESHTSSEPALLIDMKTGTIRHRYSLRMPDALAYRFEENARLHGRTVWWQQLDKESEQLKLFAQDHDQKQKVCVHSWNQTDNETCHIKWAPYGTGLFLVQSYIPQELLAVASVSPFGFTLPCNLLLNRELAEDGKLCLFQIWQLPSAPANGLKRVSSWVFSTGRHDNISFSDDGTMLAIADEGQHDVRGVLLYDTKTGQQIKKLGTERPVRIAEFQGSYLFCNVVDLYPAYWKDMVEKPLKMAEGHPVLAAREGAAVKLPDSFSNDAGMSVDMEAHPADPQWVFIRSRPNIRDMKSIHDDWRIEYVLLKREDNRFVMQSRFTMPKGTQLHWLGQEQLLAGSSGTIPPAFLTKLGEDYAWVKSAVQKFWAMEKHGVSVFGPQGDKRWHFDDAKFVNSVWMPSQGTRTIDPSRFVLARGSRGDNCYSRIECYSLPNSFYSLWWARSAGIAVAVLMLVALCWRRQTAKNIRPVV